MIEGVEGYLILFRKFICFVIPGLPLHLTDLLKDGTHSPKLPFRCLDLAPSL